MTAFLKAAALLLLGTLLCATATATHLTGGELTYTYVSGNTYELKLVVYHDCNAGANVVVDSVLHFESASCGYDYYDTLTATVRNKPITNLCNPASEFCVGGNAYGMRQTVFRKLHTFPAQCNDWIVSYDAEDRETAIPYGTHNLGQLVAQHLYLEATLNTVLADTNSSVQYNLRPMTYLRLNEQNSIHTNYTEADGDSVHWTFIEPRAQGGSIMWYNANATVTNPIFGAISLDHETSVITATPNVPQTSVIVIKAEEYRNGQLIGSTMREFLTLTPSTTPGSYNPASYLHSDTISTTESWTAASLIDGSIYILDTLYIDHTGDLTISDGAVINFGPRGHLIVDWGGQLTLSNASVDVCDNDYMWRGIEVWGLCNNPGTATLQNGAQVNNAHIGVQVGQTCETCPEQYNPLAGFGVIDAHGSSWNQCAVGVRFAHSWCTCNLVDSCAFVGGTLQDVRYNANTTPANEHYPDAAHPTFAASTALAQAAVGMQALQGNYHRIVGCTFTDMVRGMEAHDSHFYLDGGPNKRHEFTDITWGIDLNHTPGMGGLSMKVKHNSFSNVVAAISINNSWFDDVSNNLITTDDNDQEMLGIHLNHCQGYTVMDNTISRCLYGIIADNSVGQGAVIGARGDGNTFTDCWRGVHTQQDNSNLQISCSDFTPNASGVYSYDKNWTITGQLPDQGYYDPLQPNHQRNPAGNDFFTGTKKEIESSAQPFTYYRHSAPSTVIPTPDGVLAATDIFDNGVAKTADACGIDSSPVRMLQLTELAARIDELNDEYGIACGKLDNYNTTGLLLALNEPRNTSSYLRSTLLNHSPLSDAVLTAWLQHTSATDSDVRDVMLMNTPVSTEVRPVLATRMAAMPASIRTDIENVLVYNPNERTPAGIDKERLQLVSQRQALLNIEVVELLQDEANIGQAIALLDAEKTERSKRALVMLHIAEARSKRHSAQCPASFVPTKELNDAKTRLGDLTLTTPEETAWANLLDLAIDYQLQQKSLHDLNNGDEQLVRSTCASYPRSLAWANGRCLLRTVFAEAFPLIIDEPAANKHNTAEQQTITTATSQMGQIFPNPATTAASLTYELPTGTAGTLRISDLSGRVVASLPLTPGQHTIALPVSDLPQGVYLCETTANGELIDTQRLVVSN